MAQKKQRMPMKAVSETARAWAGALATELAEWPRVTVKNAFGMSMIYRGGVVFAALPNTRSLYVEDAILMKFLSEPPGLAKRIAAEERFAAGTMAQQGNGNPRKGESRFWRVFLIRESGDVHVAMEWLGEAYRIAGRKRESAG
jgi:hypothetical protein